MAITFPSSPSTGQVFTAGNRSWTWDGSSWKGGVASTGDAGTLDGLDSTDFIRSNQSDVALTGGLSLGSRMSVGLTSAESLPYYSNKLVLEVSSQDGITIAANDTSATNYLMFADGTSGDARYRGYIEYNHNTENLAIAQAAIHRLNFSNTEAVFNEAGNSYDFRVESDTITHALYVKGSNGNVGIGTSSPANRLHVDYSVSTSSANLAESKSLAAIAYHPLRNSSNYGMYFGNTALNTGYVQITDGSSSGNMLINPYGGNVGIQNTSPNFPLHINKGTSSYAPTSGVNENVFGINTTFDAEGQQGITFSRLDGNWLDGTTGADSAFGWLWNFGNNVRGGMTYDHRNTEQFQIFSSYAPIVFYTPDSITGNGVPTNSNIKQRMTIMPGGNVGIGITNPSYPLHISGAGSQRLKIEKTDAGGDADISIAGPSDSIGWLLFTDSTQGNNSGVIKYVHSTNKMHFRTNDVDDRLVISSNGDVGIGTDNPKRPLQIGATGSFPISFNGNYPDIHMNTYYESGWRIHTAGFGAKTTFNGATGAFGFSNVASSQAAAATFTPVERLTILANGNIGIGTDNPGAKLTLSGGTTTTQTFQSSWSSGTGRIAFVGGSSGVDGSSANSTAAKIESLATAPGGAATGDLRFITNSGDSFVDAMLIDKDGDVAIGKTTAFSKLYVHGGGSTKKNITTLATSSMGGGYPDLDTAAVILGSNGGRNAVANNYIAGIGFDMLLNHSSTGPFNYAQNPHGWIGLKMWDFPGYERASLVFCTREDTTSASAKTIERMQITPFGNVGINRTSPPAKLTVAGAIRIELNSGPTGQYSSGTDMHRDGSLIFPITSNNIVHSSGTGKGWCSMGWASTARSGEVMHRYVGPNYRNNGTGSDLGFYIEAGMGEAGGICLDEDSVNVYGSSDNGTTFRVIDKDSDIVTMEMLQSSWNMNVRGSVNGGASMSSISDQRLKKNFSVVSTDNILSKFSNLQLKSYIRIDSYEYMKNRYQDEDDLREIGLIAQEVEEIFPECVGSQDIVDPRGMQPIFDEIGETLTETKNLNINQLLYKTIEAVQALTEENTALKARLDAAGL